MNSGRVRIRSNRDKDEAGVIEGGVEEEEVGVVGVVVAGTAMGMEM